MSILYWKIFLLLGMFNERQEGCTRYVDVLSICLQ